MHKAMQVRRIAVVGAGYFSQFHLHGWQTVPGIEIAMVCDADAGKAQAAAQQCGATQHTTRVADLFDAQVDLIDVVTPPSAHLSLVTQALDLGVAVICQKPFGQSYAQALQLARHAQAAQVPLVVHENFRFMPWYREMRRLIDAGLLGEVHGASFRLRPGDGQGPEAYLNRQPYFQTLPRFLVMETAVHLIDTFRYLCGEVNAVYARLRRLNPVIAGEDAGFIHFEFESGAHGCFDGNRLNDHVASNPRLTMGEMWLEGSRGVLTLNGDAQLFFKPHHAPITQLSYAAGDSQQFGGGACGALQGHVVAALQNGETPENTADSYLRNLLIQEAVYASHASGTRIEIDGFTPALHSPLFSPLPNPPVLRP